MYKEMFLTASENGDLMQTDFYEISKQTIRLYWDTSVIYNIG